MGLRLRAATTGDFSAFVAIEKETFPCPWPAEAFTDFLLPWAWTLLLDDEIIGYIFYHGFGDEMVIINFGIRPCYQGRGWGDFTLKTTLESMTDTGVQRFFLDVRVSNTVARKLYEKYGFVSLGLRKNYYSHPEEDAIVMGKVVT